MNTYPMRLAASFSSFAIGLILMPLNMCLCVCVVDASEHMLMHELKVLACDLSVRQVALCQDNRNKHDYI